MAHEQDTQEFSCSGPVSATVRIGGGSLTVTAHEHNVAVVSVTPYDSSDTSRSAAAQTAVSFQDDRLRVEAPQGGGGFLRHSGRVRVDLRLPHDSALRAQVGSADVQTDGRLRDVNVQGGSGDISVTELVGDLSVESGSGDVRAADIRGGLRVKTGSGDVTASSVTGATVVNVASGNVEIERSGATVHVHTASGDVRIGAAHGSEVQVNSASGDVSVGVPAGTGVWLDLATMSGSTSSDLDRTPAGSKGDAQLNLRIHTMSGDITVHRVAATTHL